MYPFSQQALVSRLVKAIGPQQPLDQASLAKAKTKPLATFTWMQLFQTEQFLNGDYWTQSPINR